MKRWNTYACLFLPRGIIDDRPVYVYTEGYNGTSPPGENDALIIVYTGSRYFGFYYAGLRWKDLDFWIEFAKGRYFSMN